MSHMRRGSTASTVALSMGALVLMSALAVNVGMQRAQLAHLKSATSAAALAAAYDLDGTSAGYDAALSTIGSIAKLNGISTDGYTVEIGTWDATNGFAASGVADATTIRVVLSDNGLSAPATAVNLGATADLPQACLPPEPLEPACDETSAYNNEDDDHDGRKNYEDHDDDNDHIDDRDDHHDNNYGDDDDDDDDDDDATPPRWQVHGACDGDWDGDGISDHDEGRGDDDDDHDGDGKPNWKDDDSDGDGISDAREGHRDVDGDGKPNYRDEDSDDDHHSDHDENTACGGGDDDDDDDDDDCDEDGDGVPDVQDADDFDTCTAFIRVRLVE